MVIFDKLVNAIIDKTEVQETRLTNMAVERVIPAIKHKTVIGDLIEDPENFKLEAYFEGRGLVIKIEPKSDVVIYS